MLELLLFLMLIIVFFSSFRSKGFTRKLKKELPKWVEAGLISEEQAPKILAEVDKNSAKHSLSKMFAILGAVLLASGIITFFAANWEEMSKLLKLIVLFAAMWGAFFFAWLAEQRSHDWLYASMLLLGVLLFGANIMLIAQIYHIDSHYPDGVMVWSLGALLVSWQMRSAAVFVAGLLLAVLWTGMEAFDFSRLHWPFLLVLTAYGWLALREEWHKFSHLLMSALILWMLFSYSYFIREGHAAAAIYLTQFYLLTFLAMFLAGLHLEQLRKYSDWAETIRQYSAVSGLIALWALTFPDFLKNGSGFGSQIRMAAESGWLIATLLMLTIVTGLALWHRQITLAQQIRQRWHMAGLAILAFMLLCLVSNLFVSGQHASPMAIAFNLSFFLATLWLIYAGSHLDSSQLVNLGFIFFAIGILARYFDIFWKLLDRSFFFMAGGVLLIGVAAILDRKRRQVMAEMQGGEL